MKIGIVSNLYPPFERGGAELVAQRIADELYRRGHKVFVLTTEPFHGIESFIPHLQENHIEKVYRFFPKNLYHISNSARAPVMTKIFWHVIDIFNHSSQKALRVVADLESPDVFLTHNLKGLGISVSREIQKLGIRQIHTIHDVQLSVPSGIVIYGKEHAWANRVFARRIYEREMKKAIGAPDVVISPSRYLLDFYRQRGFFINTRAQVLRNPVPKIDYITRVKRSEGATKFLFVGQIEEHKGIKLLLESLNELTFNFELHIVGAGELEDYVCDWSRRDRRVTYHGFIPLDNVVSIMSRMDAVVVPSLCYENSPTVIYESLQTGVPVVASDIGGIGELIVHGKNGFLIEPGNKDSLVAALFEVEQKKDWFWSQANNIRNAMSDCSLSNYVDQLESFFKS